MTRITRRRVAWVAVGVILPADAFHATGHAGQFVTMIPSARLVVVRLGLTRYAGAWDQSGFVRDVLDAIGDTAR